jgi:THO complex subunit 1
MESQTKWAIDMKKSIAEYLKQGLEGAFFYRMVETVLSRDKNWVRWKIENCPSIARLAVTPEDYVAAKASARKATTNKRLRPNPLGSLDLKFLSQGDGESGLERLKNPTRYQLPSIKSFRSKIELDDMDIDMARDEESKNAVIESKASKSWRALRIASTTKLVAFDKIERSDKIDEIFQDDVKPEEPIINGEDETLDSDEPIFPKDRRPIVISGPSGVGKGTLIKMLIDKHPKVLGKKASHTTRAPREGEVNGQHYFFVNREEFDVMRDGDEFLEFNNFNDNDYGTSQKVVEGIIAQGKVPVMEMDMHVSRVQATFTLIFLNEMLGNPASQR